MLTPFLTFAPAHSASHAEPKPEPEVHLAPTGNVYHRHACMVLKHLKKPAAVTREQACQRGRRECYYCFPDKA